MALPLQDQWRPAWQPGPTSPAAVRVVPRWHIVHIATSTGPPYDTLCGRQLHVRATSLTGSVPDAPRCFKCAIIYKTAIRTALVL
jgi:hypothetical protein